MPPQVFLANFPKILPGLSWHFVSRYKAGEIVVMDRVQGYMDGPRLLRMRLGELVPHSLGWNCTLGV